MKLSIHLLSLPMRSLQKIPKVWPLDHPIWTFLAPEITFQNFSIWVYHDLNEEYKGHLTNLNDCGQESGVTKNKPAILDIN